MQTHNCPKKVSYASNICAFCNFWEGDAGLQSASTTTIKFDEKAKGLCLKTRITKYSYNSACSKFEMSPNASRYAK